MWSRAFALLFALSIATSISGMQLTTFFIVMIYLSMLLRYEFFKSFVTTLLPLPFIGSLIRDFVIENIVDRYSSKVELGETRRYGVFPQFLGWFLLAYFISICISSIMGLSFLHSAKYVGDLTLFFILGLFGWSYIFRRYFYFMPVDSLFEKAKTVDPSLRYNRLELINIVMVISVIIGGLYVLYQVLSGQKPEGFFMMRLTVAEVFSMVGVYLLGVMLFFSNDSSEKDEVSELHKKALVVGIVISLLVVVMAKSRMPMITYMLVSSGLIYYVYRIKGVKYILGLVVLVIGAVLVFPATQARFFNETAAQLSNYQDLTRLQLWELSIDIARDNPFFGIGYGNISGELEKLVNAHNLVVNTVAHAHNIYLQQLVLNGIVGLIIFVAIFGSILLFFYKIKKYNNFAVIGIAVTLELLFEGITENNFDDSEVLSAYVFLLSICLGQTLRSRAIMTNEQDKHKVTEMPDQESHSSVRSNIFAIDKIKKIF